METNTFKKTWLSCLLIWLTNTTLLNAQILDWAAQAGGNDSEQARAIASDASGNVYTTGYFSGTADFDPGAGVFNLTSAGSWDIFICKLNSTGQFQWAHRFGNTQFDSGSDIMIDNSGNILCTGRFWGTVDFDPGPGIFQLTSAGSWDAFLLKLDPQGNLIYAISFGGTAQEEVFSSALDPSGSVLISGYFAGTADFDPGPGVFTLSSAGSWDIFILKLDPNGQFIWVAGMGGLNSDFAKSLACDHTGNIFVTGYFSGTMDIDPGSAVLNFTSAGSHDIFVCKLSPSGTLLWAHQLGGKMADEAYSVTTDAAGNCYIAASFRDTADFDPGPAVYHLISANGKPDMAFCKFDPSGQIIWVKTAGGPSFDYPQAMITDAAGYLYITGYFSGTADLNPDAALVDSVVSVGDYDIVVFKWDIYGKFYWACSMGGLDNDRGLDIALDPNQNVLTTGFFFASCDFDPGTGTLLFSSFGNEDIFFHKIKQLPLGTTAMPIPEPFCTATPNPFSDFIHLNCKLPSEELSFVLYDITGRPVLTPSVSLLFNTGLLTVPVSHLPNGFYMLRIQANPYTCSLPLVKTN